MKRNNASIIASFAALGIFVLILDSPTALAGAGQGIELCIKTVIPSLFPFFVLSDLLTGNLLGMSLPFLRPIGKLCRMPKGSESIFLVGILGGYPVGARCIASARKAGALSASDGRRMLGFCNNAGPAFLFGMTAFLFPERIVPWLLYAIQVLSALAVGFLLPGESSVAVHIQQQQKSIAQAMYSSLKAMANVCGWIILFRVLLSFCRRWFLWLFPLPLQIGICGTLELSNGILSLQEITAPATRFLLCSLMLSLGGICVAMQTVSVTGQLGLGSYIPGKLLQSIFCFFLSTLCAFFLWKLPVYWIISAAVMLLLSCVILLWRKHEKNSSFSTACVV